MRFAKIIDPYSEGTFHEVVNTSLAMMVSMKYDKVEYVAKRNTNAVTKDFLSRINFSAPNITFKNGLFKLLKNRNGLTSILNSLLISIYDIWHYVFAKSGTDIFFNLNPRFAVLFFQYFPIFKKRVFILCHYEMEFLTAKAEKSGLVYQKLYRFIFCKMRLSKRIHFIVLGDSIKNNIAGESAAHNRERIFSIDHPQIRANAKNLSDSHKFSALPKTDAAVKLGIASHISKNRGLDNLNEFLLKFKNSNCRIYAISTIEGKTERNECFAKLSGEKQFAALEYSGLVSQMDSLLYFYDVDSYKFTASGSVLEAIEHGTPIIALRNDYFAYLFGKFGDMGVLCDSVEEMLRVIENYDIFSRRKEEFERNMRNAKEALRPQNIVSDFAKILEDR